MNARLDMREKKSWKWTPISSISLILNDGKFRSTHNDLVNARKSSVHQRIKICCFAQCEVWTCTERCWTHKIVVTARRSEHGRTNFHLWWSEGRDFQLVYSGQTGFCLEPQPGSDFTFRIWIKLASVYSLIRISFIRWFGICVPSFDDEKATR